MKSNHFILLFLLVSNAMYASQVSNPLPPDLQIKLNEIDTDIRNKKNDNKLYDILKSAHKEKTIKQIKRELKEKYPQLNPDQLDSLASHEKYEFMKAAGVKFLKEAYPERSEAWMIEECDVLMEVRSFSAWESCIIL